MRTSAHALPSQNAQFATRLIYFTARLVFATSRFLCMSINSQHLHYINLLALQTMLQRHSINSYSVLYVLILI
jgi:hypothetical protein